LTPIRRTAAVSHRRLKQEPVFAEHDGAIYAVTPKLFGTKAIKGEMIIYPPAPKPPTTIMKARNTSWITKAMAPRMPTKARSRCAEGI
jgi:hypothetical protein